MLRDILPVATTTLYYNIDTGTKTVHINTGSDKELRQQCNWSLGEIG